PIAATATRASVIRRLNLSARRGLCDVVAPPLIGIGILRRKGTSCIFFKGARARVFGVRDKVIIQDGRPEPGASQFGGALGSSRIFGARDVCPEASAVN